MSSSFPQFSSSAPLPSRRPSNTHLPRLLLACSEMSTAVADFLCSCDCVTHKSVRSLCLCPHGDNIAPERRRDKSFAALFASLTSSQERERVRRSSDWSAPASPVRLSKTASWSCWESVHILREIKKIMNGEWKIQGTEKYGHSSVIFHCPGFPPRGWLRK